MNEDHFQPFTLKERLGCWALILAVLLFWPTAGYLTYKLWNRNTAHVQAVEHQESGK